MANNHGGSRPNSGRKSTKHEFIDDGLVTPLMFMLAVMRDEKLAPSIRYQAAKDCAPYCSARLQSRELTVDADVSIELISYLDADD